MYTAGEGRRTCRCCCQLSAWLVGTFCKLPRRHRHHLAISAMEHAHRECGSAIFRTKLITPSNLNVIHGTARSHSFTIDRGLKGDRDFHCGLPVRRFRLRSGYGTSCVVLMARSWIRSLRRLYCRGILRCWEKRAKNWCSHLWLVSLRHAKLGRRGCLRESLLAALPEEEVAARRPVDDVTPHSFRPGLA